MKWCAAVLCFFLLLLSSGLWGQAKLQTLVPRQGITVGNAFQVQYIVQDLKNFQELQTPDFGADFQLVSGPSIYQGTIISQGISIPVQNYTYTLVPLRKGKLMVQGATVVYNSGRQEAPVAFVTSTTAPPPKPQNTYVTHVPLFAQSPPQDLEKSMRRHLFITASASKKECYIGEPVVATFTLFSKLLSSSEVVKNPGFYGFSVVDMPQAAGVPQTVENINGSTYNKHLLRQVQLYPMQEGQLVIDEMTVYNAVELKDSVTGGQREKELMLTSTPMAIMVKPLPVQGRPDSFSGAVGTFVLKAHLATNKIALGETGKLLLTLEGKGNFLQLDAPPIQWPQRVEGFEPVLTEQLHKEQVPVAGSRQYQYQFTADSLGQYAIAPISFSFFNPVSKTYQTTTTDTLHFTVIAQNRLQAFFTSRRAATGTTNRTWLIVAAGALAVVILLGWFIIKKRKKPVAADTTPLPAPPTYKEQLTAIAATGKESYRQLQQILYGFLKENYGIPTSSKAYMEQQLSLAPITPPQKEKLLSILNECEVVQYYDATPTLPFTTLQQQALELVHQLEIKA